MQFFSMILLFVAIIFATAAQGKVNATFRRYSRVANKKGMTGREAARRVLDQNGLRDVDIEPIKGSLTDHYDPRKKVLGLSEDVYGGTTISAVSVACHEAGHAIQHSRSYIPLKVRNAIVPIVSIASMASWPLIIVGIILLSSNTWQLGNLLFDIGVITFASVVFFHLITLPVELDASRRAINQMQELSIVADSGEVAGARKVLNAAALTYVAALAVAAMNLLRILVIRGRR